MAVVSAVAPLRRFPAPLLARSLSVSVSQQHMNTSAARQHITMRSGMTPWGHGGMGDASRNLVASSFHLGEQWPTIQATASARAELSKTFAKYDKSGDGFITLQRMREALAECGYALDELEEDPACDSDRIAVVDCDASGPVDYYAYISYGMGEASSSLDRAAFTQLMTAFRALDMDGDGKISRSELFIGLTRNHAIFTPAQTSDMIGRIMLAADRDGDGQIDFYEFIVFMFASSSCDV